MRKQCLFLLILGSGVLATPALKSLLTQVQERKVTPEAGGKPAPPQGLRIAGEGASGSTTQAVPRFEIVTTPAL